MSLYNNVLQNLVGDERVRAIKTMDNDKEFDEFLRSLDRETNRSTSKTTPQTANEKSGKTMVRVPKEEFFRVMGTEYGGKK